MIRLPPQQQQLSPQLAAATAFYRPPQQPSPRVANLNLRGLPSIAGCPSAARIDATRTPTSAVYCVASRAAEGSNTSTWLRKSRKSLEVPGLVGMITSRPTAVAAGSFAAATGGGGGLPSGYGPAPAAGAAATGASSASTAGGAAEGVAVAPAVVFTVEACKFCREAKAALAEAGVPYEEVKVGVGRADAADVRRALAEATGLRTVPVVFVGGVQVGGCDELKKAIASGQVARLLSGPPEPLPPPIFTLIQKLHGNPQQGQQSLEESSADAAGSSGADAAAGGGWGGVAGQMAQLAQDTYERMRGHDHAGDGSGLEGGKRRKGLPRDERWEGLRVLRKVFTGAAAVRWMLQNVPQLEGKGTDDAVALGRAMEAMGLLHHVHCAATFADDDSLLFRLLHDEPPLSKSLNAAVPWLRPARSAAAVARELRQRTLALYEEALSLDGKSVDYSKLKGSASFEAYVGTAQELQKVDVLALSRSEQKAFWINVYNSLIIHALVAVGPPSNPLQRLSFYSSTSYRVSSLEFSLDAIENGILRANRAPSSSLVGSRYPFGPDDPRRFYSLPPCDPRIHFALNCGARSCPPVKLYSAPSLDAELDSATEAFLDSDVAVNVEDGTVEVTKLIQWYARDFGATEEERVQWMLQYLSREKREQAERVLASGSVKLRYRDYDWSTNSL